MLLLTSTQLYPPTTPSTGWLIHPVYAYSNGQYASLVLGQSPPSFTTNTHATTQNGMNYPYGVAFDSHGNLWVADYASSRVLEFTPPFTNGMSAALELGQAQGTCPSTGGPGTCFTTSTGATTQNGMNVPEGVGVDSHGNLWVADYGNNRVLEFTCTATSSCVNGNNAALVLGQADFTHGGFATTQNGMYYPRGVGFDSHGNLWVADFWNSRVLEFWVNGVGADSSTVTLSGSGEGSFASSLTGVTVTISGSTASASVFIVPQVLSSQSSGVGTLSLSNGKFFDVAISGVTTGTAQVCVTDSSADSETILQYWSGSAWVTASGITVAGTTVCGNIPVSALQGTNIGAGDPVPTTTTATTSQTTQPRPLPVGGVMLPSAGVKVLLPWVMVLSLLGVVSVEVFLVRRRARRRQGAFDA
jgi:hypothetical protein